MTDLIKKIGIIGSWRSKEQTEGERCYHRKDDFPIFCEQIGKFLADQGFILVVGWSNDFLNKQVIDNDYHFEETADYHTLVGYLKNPAAKPIVYISERSLKLFQLTIKINLQKCSIPEDKYNSFLNELKNKDDTSLVVTNSLTGIFTADDLKFIKDLREKQKGKFDGLTYLAYLVNSDVEILSKVLKLNYNGQIIPDNLLRLTITQHVILPDINLLLTIGGGKATENALDNAIKNLLPFIPVFSYGGETDDLILKNKITNSINDIRDQKIREEYVQKFSNYSNNFKIKNSDITYLKAVISNFVATELSISYPSNESSDEITQILNFILTTFIVDMEDYEKLKTSMKDFSGQMTGLSGQMTGLSGQIDEFQKTFNNWFVQFGDILAEIKTIALPKSGISEEIIISVGWEVAGNGISKKIHITTQNYSYQDILAELQKSKIITRDGKTKIENILKNLFSSPKNLDAINNAIKSGIDDIYIAS